MNIGINTGAKIAHLADALPIKRFKNADKRMKQIINGKPVKPTLFKNSAPLIARIKPRLL
jgi:hypothetical protein